MNRPATYLILHNQDARFSRPGTAEDTYLVGYLGELPEEGANDPFERVFALHNQDDRPDGQMRPSLSVGDVVIITAYPGTAPIARARTVDGIGWETLDGYPTNILVTDRQVVDA